MPVLQAVGAFIGSPRFPCAIALAALLGGGCSEDFGRNELPRPLHIWTERGGMCADDHTLDAEGAVWHQRRCESSGALQRKATVDAQTRDAVAQQFLALPPRSEEGCARRHEFFGPSTAVKGVCGQGAGPGDLYGLPDPYLTVAKFFMQYEP